MIAHGYQSDFARTYYGQGLSEGEARGEARGEAKSLLMVLTARGLDVNEDIRARITSCTDTEQLATWLRRAATADSVEDVLR